MNAQSLELNAGQLLCIGRLLRDRIEFLRDQLSDQVQVLPPGNDGWIPTIEELELLHPALIALENAIHEAGT